MNKQQDKLFDMINDNGFDMEDLITNISYKEINKLIEVFEEFILEMYPEQK